MGESSREEEAKNLKIKIIELLKEEKIPVEKEENNVMEERKLPTFFIRFPSKKEIGPLDLVLLEKKLTEKLSFARDHFVLIQPED